MIGIRMRDVPSAKEERLPSPWHGSITDSSGTSPRVAGAYAGHEGPCAAELDWAPAGGPSTLCGSWEDFGKGFGLQDATLCCLALLDHLPSYCD